MISLQESWTKRWLVPLERPANDYYLPQSSWQGKRVILQEYSQK